MKKIFVFVLTAALLGGTPQVSAQEDSLKAEATAAVAVEDSGYNYNYAEDAEGEEVPDIRIEAQDHSLQSGWMQGWDHEMVMCVIIVFIVFACLTMLIFSILYFRHRSKQAKYNLAAKALENGQPIPDGLLGTYSGYSASQQRERQASQGDQQASQSNQPASQSNQQASNEEAAAQAESRREDFLGRMSYLYRTSIHMRKGLQQLFLGLGLLAFVSVAGWGSFFAGLSFLVIFIALGQIVAAYLESDR
jgi:Flp pilus assembly protein TadB